VTRGHCQEVAVTGREIQREKTFGLFHRFGFGKDPCGSQHLARTVLPQREQEWCEVSRRRGAVEDEHDGHCQPLLVNLLATVDTFGRRDVEEKLLQMVLAPLLARGWSASLQPA
jgi:hypothetical protein